MAKNRKTELGLLGQLSKDIVQAKNAKEQRKAQQLLTRYLQVKYSKIMFYGIRD